jgi:hypothetical protein
MVRPRGGGPRMTPPDGWDTGGFESLRAIAGRGRAASFGESPSQSTSAVTV